MRLGYLGLDQFGNNFTMQAHPRKELIEQLGYRSASKMYTERKDGSSFHSGYIVGPHWIRVLEVHPWSHK